MGDDGEWIADDLMEGVYEVIVDLPAGYVHVNESGAAADDRVNGDATANTYFTQQVAELAGGRADAGTKMFHIKDRNAGDGIVIESVLIDGDACGYVSRTPWRPRKPDASTTKSTKGRSS